MWAHVIIIACIGFYVYADGRTSSKSCSALSALRIAS